MFHLASVYEKLDQPEAAEQVRTRLLKLAGPEDPRVQFLKAQTKTPEKQEVDK